MRKNTFEIGDKFGLWTVIDNNSVIKGGHSYVKVRCNCGKEELKSSSDLKNNRTTGCKSCKAQERSKNIKIGDKYKHWKVTGGMRVYKNAVQWNCTCDCGRSTRWIQANELTNPNKCFECQQCAAERRGNIQSSSNGKIGELSLTRFTKLKKSAERRNIEFNITIEFLWNLFISQNKKCAITGDTIESFSHASLDRIDSTKGYIEGNVQWVTYQSNVSKHIMSMNELYVFCRKVLNHANQQPSTPLTKGEGSTTNS